jgi:hypothetical protein
MSQQPTEKSDVCIFGVVMLELVITKQPIEKGKYIVREVKTAFDASDTEFCRIKGMIDAIISERSASLFSWPYKVRQAGGLSTRPSRRSR